MQWRQKWEADMHEKNGGRKREETEGKKEEYLQQKTEKLGLLRFRFPGANQRRTRCSGG